MKKTLVMLLAICLIVSFTGCGSEEMDYNNPDVTLCEAIEDGYV